MRSKYIYFIYNKCNSLLTSAHTVKHEAHTWMQRFLEKRKGHRLEDFVLYRMLDGLDGEKGLHPVEWDSKLFDADLLTKSSSQVDDWLG